jgi:hypothetical protein
MSHLCGLVSLSLPSLVVAPLLNLMLENTENIQKVFKQVSKVCYVFRRAIWRCSFSIFRSLSGGLVALISTQISMKVVDELHGPKAQHLFNTFVRSRSDL